MLTKARGFGGPCRGSRVRPARCCRYRHAPCVACGWVSGSGISMRAPVRSRVKRPSVNARPAWVRGDRAARISRNRPNIVYRPSFDSTSRHGALERCFDRCAAPWPDATRTASITSRIVEAPTSSLMQPRVYRLRPRDDRAAQSARGSQFHPRLTRTATRQSGRPGLRGARGWRRQRRPRRAAGRRQARASGGRAG